MKNRLLLLQPHAELTDRYSWTEFNCSLRRQTTGYTDYDIQVQTAFSDDGVAQGSNTPKLVGGSDDLICPWLAAFVAC